jgi:hypothetical protein
MSRPRDQLFLHEEILLLALRDQEGTTEPGSTYEYALGGAILAELLLNERIKLEQVRRKKLVDFVSARPLRDPVLDECLGKVADAKRRADAQAWVSRFAGAKKLKHRIAEQLCDRGILRAEDAKVLFVFTRKVYPERNPAPERALVERMRKAVFTETRDVDPRTVVLISLAKAADLLKIPFDKKRLKERRKRIEQLISGELTGKAAREAADAAEAATEAAVLICCIS